MGQDLDAQQHACGGEAHLYGDMDGTQVTNVIVNDTAVILTLHPAVTR
jgi:hypothetical protein